MLNVETINYNNFKIKSSLCFLTNALIFSVHSLASLASTDIFFVWLPSTYSLVVSGCLPKSKISHLTYCFFTTPTYCEGLKGGITCIPSIPTLVKIKVTCGYSCTTNCSQVFNDVNDRAVQIAMHWSEKSESLIGEEDTRNCSIKVQDWQLKLKD